MKELLGFNYLLLSDQESVNEAPLVISVQDFKVFYESSLDKSIDFFHILNKSFVVLQEESKGWEHIVQLQDAEMKRKKKQLLSKCTAVQQYVLTKARTEKRCIFMMQNTLCPPSLASFVKWLNLFSLTLCINHVS